MNIIEFFFGIFKECFNVINVDFFGLGFTWLELLLGVAIIFVIMNFLKSIVGVGDSITFDSFVHNYKMTNRNRENEIVSSSMTQYLDSGNHVYKEKHYFKDKNHTHTYVSVTKGDK